MLSRDADDAFGEFVQGRAAHLFRLALLLSGQNRADAEDLLQTALERAYRRRSSLLRAGSPEPYVRQVLVNASIDRWRRLRRRREAPLGAGPDPAVSDQTGQIADRDLLARALAALPARQRAVLVLRYWADMPEAEIAAVLGCGPGTVRSHISHGLSRLRQLDELRPGQLQAQTEVHDSRD
jgi:RNA polymerase sigma-70 factor (sigma-E family)